MSEKSVNWTIEQQQVIESRGCNLLVSAAAGSGKTAVLVERIIRMVTEGDHPLDIDKLLVMTFTNAAAAEMRERIGAAIEERLAKEPDNEHLQIQEALVHHAQITTIDSFCLNVIRNHFNLLDLDPSFRIGDEGELTLLRADVMQEMLEDYYEKDDPEFVRFVETYAQGKSDAGIEDYIMQVYTFSQSNPYPDQWLARCRDGQDDGWMRFLMDDVRRQAGELKFQMTDALDTCQGDEYLCAYAPMFHEDIGILGAIEKAENYEQLHGLLSGISWARLATVRSKEVDPEKKAYVTGCRDRMKKAVSKMQDLYCFAALEEMETDMEKAAASMGTLLELAGEFSRRFQEKKRDRNLVDFNDLEHEALRVLIRFEDGKTVYTEAADELSAQFEEVLVDEYQDSNLVQEALLHAVSRERFGRYNVFMVGDVKQSIYKFRLARPELFLEKYHTYEPYGTGAGLQKKIELHQNFRSRAQVLSGINDVFFQIMTENLGNIRYTDETALHPGAHFKEPEEAMDRTASEKETQEPRRIAELPELLVMDTGDAALSQMDDEAADYTAKELEAKLIVSRIRELTDPQNGLLVWDKKLNGSGGYRTCRYRDIVILLRSTAGWTETFLSVMMNEGIPAYAESRMGYFNTIEVETVLSLLAVIDNPMQDIPLAAVLKSPVVGLSDLQLAAVMAFYRGCADKGQDRGIYAAVYRYLAGAEEDAGLWETAVPEEAAASEETAAPENAGSRENAGISEISMDPDTVRKLRDFLCLLQELRRESAYLSIHELIYRVYEKTGYYHYVAAMPAGETRKANLDMLVEKAAAYEQTSYRGLFNFIRYIENLKKYNTDFGEATTIGEEDDTVRIMSIHKSKGLEFSVCFLAGMGKKFNRQDVYGKILIDPELGIGTDYMDPELRLKSTTLRKNVLRRKMELDNLGEELRVLYVAMTRAKEKLIMTGTDRYLAKSMKKYAQVPVVNGQIPYTVLSTAGSYLDWLLMSMAGGRTGILLTRVPVSDMVGEELMRQVASRQAKDQLLNMDPGAVYDPDYRQMLDDRLNGTYPHQADILLHTKMSVSELKKQGQLVDEEESVCEEGLAAANPVHGEKPSISESETVESETVESETAESRTAAFTAAEPSTGRKFPEIMADNGRGAARGTAFHRAMELLPFDRLDSLDAVDSYLLEMVAARRFTKENYDLVSTKVIWRFLQTDLGRRMSLAQREGRLHKEQQFVMGLPAREMGVADSEELVVIQGIIDAYMEEDGQLVLIDYKTDHVRKAQTLIDHYKRQLDYYERALQQMTGKKVKEKIIYSLTLMEEIRL